MTSVIAILAFGFLLGMRHATDPDHVIAVSTIVSRERSIVKAGLIGALWGVGHTVTILIVGAAIILLGIAIPARLGLTMEFSVGLMLILLGVLNLTGAIAWITDKFSPAHPKVEGSHAHLHEHDAKLHIHWHTHVGRTQHHGESMAPPRWFDKSAAKADVNASDLDKPRPVPHAAPALRRPGSRARRFSRGRAARAEHDSQSQVGGSLSFDFRGRHSRGNDADHRRHLAALFFRGIQICMAEQRTDRWFGSAESRVRFLRLLPDRIRRWPLHQPSDVDPKLNDRRRGFQLRF